MADAVLTDPHRVLKLNMAGLATAAETSEPTVSRFCTAIGYPGFLAFKHALIRAMALGQPSAVSAIKPDDSVSDLVEKVFNYTISGLDRARGQLDKTVIANAIEMIDAASDLLFIGGGSSGVVAQDAQDKFPLFGKICQAPLDYHIQFMSALMSSPTTVTVAISNTGRSRPVIEVASAAKAAGGKVISITGADSPLSQLADLDIRASTLEDTESYEPIVSRIATLAVIDILATGVALRRSEAWLDRVREMRRAIVRRRG